MECSVEGCDRSHKAMGWCQNHYMRWRRTGIGQPTRIRKRPSCTIERCTKPHFGRGYCQMHYARWRKNGDPHIAGNRAFGADEENFWRKVDRRGPDECWRWTGALSSSGYGSFRGLAAHRWLYVHVGGRVAHDQELDHLCHSADRSCPGGTACSHRKCVNPRHLEPVSPRENWSRGRAPSAANAAKTHCKYGHPYNAENTYDRPGGGRACRSCDRARAARYRAKLQPT